MAWCRSKRKTLSKCRGSSEPEDLGPVQPLTACQEGVASAISSAFCAASGLLVKRLTRTDNKSVAQQLCLASMADVLDVAVAAATVVGKPEGVDGPMLPARQLLMAFGSDHVPKVEPCGDEAAPWPLGGTYNTTSLATLARLRSLGALARLGGTLGGGVEWLEALRQRTLEVLQSVAPKLPIPADTEALVGDVTRDPLSALLVDLCIACREPFETDELGQALALCGSWPTAHALFRHGGLDFEEAEEAVVRPPEPGQAAIARR
eukprot:g1425.t1